MVSGRSLDLVDFQANKKNRPSQDSIGSWRVLLLHTGEAPMNFLQEGLQEVVFATASLDGLRTGFSEELETGLGPSGNIVEA